MSYRRSVNEKKKMSKLYKEAKNTFVTGVYYNEEKKRLMRYYIGSPNLRRFLKKRSSKATRLDRNELKQGGQYKKDFDYNWNLF